MHAADELTQILSEVPARLERISAAAAAEPLSPGRWSRKQILGHLIDSALNNQQRFIRAQIDQPLRFPGYEQDKWVALQGYQDQPWADLVRLWQALNGHLAQIMGRVPETRLATECFIGSGSPVTLGWLMSDYIRHLRHHLQQLLAS